MSIPSGLGASLGFGVESVVGTGVTPTRFVYFKKESMQLKKTTVTSDVLGNGRVNPSARRVLTSLSADGTVELDTQDSGLGLLLKQAMGSTATAVQIGSTTAYQQVHTFGSDLSGYGLTVQVGRPDVTGTMRAFTYTGAKVVDWSLGVATSAIGTFTLNLDAINGVSTTSYTAPSYTAANPLHFAQGTLAIGGTVTTGTDSPKPNKAKTSGATTISGASATAAVKAVNIKVTNPSATDRYTLGSLYKKEALVNNFAAITGDLEIEFGDLATLYALFEADTATALQFTLTGSAIGVSGYNASMDVLLPKIYLDTDDLQVDGPDILHQKVSFTALSDLTNTPIQVVYTSADTAL